jgi:DNA adenine methylase
MKAPFPWFGGKSRVAPLVWERFGLVDNYVEPFFGSGAVLLGRPHPAGTETVNDADGYLANFWRALAHDPDAVAHHADWPVNENDLHARHAYLVERRADFTRRMEGDPDYFDARMAGWWVWGICAWIGSGWCSGEGPWRVVDSDDGRGVNRQLVHLGNDGQGVNRKRVDALSDYFATLSERLREVRVCCGDWSRVLGPTPTVKLGTTAVLLDPPYADAADRTPDLYSVDTLTIAHEVREWAIAHGADHRLRIALCGYEGEHDMPDDWEAVPWKAHGGYGSQGTGKGRANAKREVVWFSPGCLRLGLWDTAA